MSRWIVPERFKVIVGGNTYINTPTIISYNGKSLFELRRSLSDGYLGIDFDIFDAKGTRVGTIRNGTFVGTAPQGYKTDYGHDHYTLTEMSSGRVICDIRLRQKAAGDAEIEVSARMYMPDGLLVELTPTQTNIGGIRMTGCTFEDCMTAVAIG